jgi:CheY-like chemotaxis protein
MAPTVLVVDDEKAICEGLAAYLEDEGMRVHAACSGEDAIDRVGAGLPVHVCIVDLRLPDMNGTQAILEIQRLAPEARFIIHTGSAEEAVITALCRVGLETTPVFRKPLHDMTEMVRTIHGLRPAASPEATAPALPRHD